MQSKPVITISELTKNYEGFHLHIDELNIDAGSFVGLIGENGAGKSTLLQLLLNQIRSDTGSIRILGSSNQKNEQQIKLKLGVVLEKNFFPLSFSASQIEKMMRDIYPSWDEALFLTLLQNFALPPTKKLKEFSRGMTVKLNFAVALAHHPQILFADEATSGLDPIVRREILALLESYVQKQKMTVVLSSHILSDLEQVASHFVFIHNGEILLQENRADLLKRFIVTTKKHKQCYQLKQAETTKYLVEVTGKKTTDTRYATLEEILLFLVKEVKIDEGTTI